jgi:hypothetical protein
LLGVKRASGPDLPCAADFVYTLRACSSIEGQAPSFMAI